MDFYSMTRKRLQSLCKKHGIPANLKNKEMAERLSLIFKGKENEDPVSCQLGSDNARTKKSSLHCVEIIDLVSPGPALEERTDFSAKIFKGSEIEMNLSPEITRDDFGICGVEEDMKSGLNKEQVGDCQKGLHSSSMVDVVTLEEFGHPLVEGEVHKSDDSICDHDAVNSVASGRFEVYTTCLDTSIGATAKETNRKTNEPVEHFIDEVHSSCKVKSSHVDIQEMVPSGAKDINEKTNVTVEHCTSIGEVHSSSEVKSNDVDIQEMVFSGTATRNADTSEARFVSSQKLNSSPASERIIGSSPKLVTNSETKVLQFEMNFSSETETVDIEICELEENLQIDVNKEQVDDNKSVEHAAPCVMALTDEDAVLVQVTSEEFGNHLVEAEVEKLGDKNNPLEDVCEIGNGRDEAVKQGDHNGPQGTDMDDVNLLHVSVEESGYPLVEVVHISEDNIYNGGVYNFENSGSKVDIKDTDGKTDLTVEHFADEVPNSHSSSFKCSDHTPDRFLTSYSLSEFNPCGVNVHQDTSEEKLKSPQKQTGPIADLEECIEFSPNKLKACFQAESYLDQGTIGDVVGTCNMKESIHSDKMEKEQSQEVLHTTNNAVVINNVNLLQKSMEECNSHSVQAEVTKLFDNSNVRDDTGGNGAGESINSPQGLNKNDLNLLLVSYKEFSSTFDKGEVLKSDDNVCDHDALYTVENERFDPICIDTSIDAMDIDGKTNVTHFIDEFHSSAFNDSDGTPVQFPPTEALSEEKFSDPNIHERVVSGNATRNADTCQVKFVSSRKISSSPTSDRMIGFSPKMPNNSDAKLLQSEMEFSPGIPRVDIAISDVKESLQIGVNKEQVYDNQEVMNATPSVMVMNTEDLVQVALEEFGNHLVQGEVDKLGDKNNLENFCENGKGRDEAIKQVDINSPLEESDYHLVEGEVQKSNDNIAHGGLNIDKNSGSEVDALCLHDTSIAAKDTFEKTNATVEHFLIDVPLTSFNHSDGTPDKFLMTDPPSEVNSSGLTTHQMVASDTCEEKLKSSQRTGLNADPEECIGFSPNDLEVSAIEGFHGETYFDPTILGDAAACNMEESIQIDMMEKDNSQEVLHTALMAECNSVRGEDTKLFDNSDVHDDASGTEAAKDKNQDDIEMDMDSMEKCFLNEFKSSDDASGQNSNEKPDEYVPTMLQPSDIRSCTSKLHQIYASDAVSGEETTFQENLESPPKCKPIASLENNIAFCSKLFESSMMKTELKIERNLPMKHARDVLGASDMKENIKTAKKEQVGTIISKNTFPKRQPLQDLQQN